MRSSDWSRSRSPEHHQECCALTSSSFSENGCTVYLPKEGSCLCLSGTQYQKHHGYEGKLCDLMLFWHDFSGHKRIAVVELKSGRIRPSEVAEQLQAGADIAMSMVNGFRPVYVAPVLVHAGGLKKADVEKFKKHKIRFAEKKPLLIQSKKCGFQVEDIRPNDWV